MLLQVGTLQALLAAERQGSTFDSTMEKELVCLRHSHDRLREIAETWALMQPGYFALMLMMTQISVLVLGDCARPCLIAWATFDLLVFFSAYLVYAHELCS